MTPVIISTTEVIRFSVVLFRIAGIMGFAPFFSSGTISFQIRAVFSLVTALLLAPNLTLEALPTVSSISDIAVILFSELLLGLVLGLAASFVFAGIQLAGQLISFQLGFSLINVIDPQSEVEAPAFSSFHNYIAILFFLLLNGHHWFFLAVNESFGYLPAGGGQIRGPLVAHMIHLSSQVLSVGLKIAAPVVAVMIVTDIVLGVIGRAAPQVNVLIQGMPLRVLVGLSCLSISFYFLPRFLSYTYLSLYRAIFALLHTMG